MVPEVAWKVEVRLDDGSEVTLGHKGDKRYAPGERVRLLIDEEGALLL
jgi:outer membrane lipoprotein SlyB